MKARTATVATQASCVSVERIWPGETIVILGGGPSLTREDAEYCRGKAKVIAIKEAAVCSFPGIVPPAPWADVLYACDAKWWLFEKGATGFPGLKFALAPQHAWPGVQALKNTGSDGLELDPAGLRTGNNSGYQAINLAVHLGAARVLLLGFDMWSGPDGEHNWFGPHPNHVRSPYPLFLQRYASIVEPLTAAGVEVINCSRQTQLKAFPRMPLEEALA